MTFQTDRISNEFLSTTSAALVPASSIRGKEKYVKSKPHSWVVSFLAYLSRSKTEHFENDESINFRLYKVSWGAFLLFKITVHTKKTYFYKSPKQLQKKTLSPKLGKWKTSYLVLKTVCTERTKESHEKQQGTAKEGKSFSVTNGRQDKTVGEKSQEAYF